MIELLVSLAVGGWFFRSAKNTGKNAPVWAVSGGVLNLISAAIIQAGSVVVLGPILSSDGDNRRAYLLSYLVALGGGLLACLALERLLLRTPHS